MQGNILFNNSLSRILAKMDIEVFLGYGTRKIAANFQSSRNKTPMFFYLNE